MSTIRFLKTFLVVAQTGTFAAASERVALTQAAVGLQMRALETELKTVLFEKSGRRVILSAAGRALVPHAENLVARYDQMRDSLDNEHEIAGTVDVGSIVSAMGLLSSTVVKLKAAHPKLKVRLVVQEAISLVQKVKNGELNAAIFVDGSEQERQGLIWTPLYSEPMTVVASSQIAHKNSDIKKLLRENPFLRFDRRTLSGVKIEQSLRKIGIVPQDFLELGSLSTIIDLVRQNVGVTIVPHPRNVDLMNDPLLQVLPLPGRPPTRQIGMLEDGKCVQITSVIRQHLVDLLKASAKANLPLQTRGKPAAPHERRRNSSHAA